MTGTEPTPAGTEPTTGAGTGSHAERLPGAGAEVTSGGGTESTPAAADESTPRHTPATVGGPPTQIVKPKRGSETILDMVRSLGLIIIVAALTLIFVPALFHPNKSERFAATDYAGAVSGFHQVTGKTALTPAPVPSGWRANAANLTGPAAAEHLHIGFAVPGSEYAGLEQSVAPAVRFARATVGASGAIPIDQVTIGGATWLVSNSSRGEYTLRRTVHGVTVIVTGSATSAQLQTFAASLR